MLGRDSALSVMCSKTLRSNLVQDAERMRNNICSTLEQIDFVATTADCWSKGKRSFLGVTAHWINPSTLERESAALACRRLKGKYTFDVLARQMYSIYLDYSIQNKIVCTKTDNGSKFCKAFRYYVINKNILSNILSTIWFSFFNRVYENQELEERENEDDNDEEFIELTSLLEGDDYSTEIILPPHHRCACHTLHLIATKDAEKAMINARYEWIFRSTLAKCHKLWAKQNQSTQAADKIKDMLGVYLKTPVVTRWNSLYDAMLQINNHITHFPDGINTCMDFCALPRFTDAEREFIKEYCQVMCPLSTALDILQGEKEMYMGYLLPALYSLKDKLDAQIMKSLIYCKPLVQVLLEGIEYRQSIWWKKELVLASCVHPRFKLAWLKGSEKREQAENWVYEEIPSPNPKMQTSGAADLEYNDFFCLTFNADVHTKTPHEQVKIFLSEQPKETDSFSCSALRKLFIKHNTALPTSASAERLFSFAGNVLSQKRCQLTDDIHWFSGYNDPNSDGARL
ncbi:hypothetical protein ILUMI_11338 [Ignelater luminosus]|uniref:Transposase n=1 Tax=Ignelater luminosus TaxID=2038154 RepID=A0A8K0GAL4_IGNLU|nr:hypothetical protein ILUMI_11338 [Ignelater luminosus]